MLDVAPGFVPAQRTITLGDTELAHVFAWCEIVDLVRAAVAQTGEGVPLATALRAVRLPAPLTSDLGPLPGGGFGPTQDAVLRWSASCACWQESSKFADRPG